MLTENKLREKLESLKNDERLTYETATIFENAPLALLQLQFKTIIQIIEEILEIPHEERTKFPIKK